MKSFFKYFTLYALCFVLLFTVIQPGIVIKSDAADSFEASLSDFPQSYRDSLRQLHTKFPKWTFKAVKTGLNFSDAVEGENYSTSAYMTRSAITSSASSLLKDKSTGYYNSSTGEYTSVDAGFVRANKIAIAYFMDPRNFLREENIFQFELLSFSDTITSSMVNTLLSGTFMYNAKMNYYDTKGKYITSNITYANCIYNAGKKYNVNPCFLASKIRNEIVTSGGNGSGSVTGKYSGYEGYYNFFNIGATAGTSPIKNGLKYASGTGSYGRPWTSPEKSIYGGAEFLSNGYISRGQDTGYFQRFNVAPYAYSKLYEHQYMSNISAADSMGYSTYKTYLSDGTLKNARIFAIPVYNNMPGEKAQVEDFAFFDSYKQTAKTTATLHLRDIPSVDGKSLTSVPNGTVVNVLSKCRNCSFLASSFTYYPFWIQVSYKDSTGTHTGYVVADYVSPLTDLKVSKETVFELPCSNTGDEKPSLYSSAASVVSVNSDGTLKALKNGTAYITATTSKGGYEYIKITVGSVSSPDVVTGFNAEGMGNQITFSWNPVSGATGYELILSEGKNTVSTMTVTGAECSAVIDGVSESKKYTAKIRAFKFSDNHKVNGEFASVSSIPFTLKKATGLCAENITHSSYRIKWTEQTYADGYVLYYYNDEKGFFTSLRDVKTNYADITDLKPGESEQYRVKAYRMEDGEKKFGEISYALSVSTLSFSAVKSLKQINTSKSGFKLTWASQSSVSGYEVWAYNSSTKAFSLYKDIKSNNLTVSGLSASYNRQYKVRAYEYSGNKKLYGPFSEILTASTYKEALSELTVTEVTTSSVSLSWKKTAGAEKYIIYHVNPSTGDLSKTGETTSLKYTVTGIGTNASHTYLVEGIKGEVKISGAKVKIHTLSKAPTGLKQSSATSNTARLTWNKVNGVENYTVYKLNTKTKKYVYVSRTKNNYYDFKDLTASSTLSVKITANFISGGKLFPSALSTAFTLKTGPKAVTGLTATGVKTTSLTLKWKKVSGAAGYNIYKYDSSTKTYKYVKWTKALSSNMTGLSKSTSYKFAVTPFYKSNGVNINGNMSSPYTVKTKAK